MSFDTHHWLKSPHIQMVGAYFWPPGSPPPSKTELIDIGNGDKLACEVSTPSNYEKTVILIHGLGGCSESPFMIRIGRKIYEKGLRVVRVNLRNCGIGKGLSQLPYNGGNSQDLDKVVRHFKGPITVIGFSMGGNIALKMAAEDPDLKVKIIAICPAYDLLYSVKNIDHSPFYHKYYLKHLLKTSLPWSADKNISTIYEFDQKVTAPLWGFKNPEEYYESASAKLNLITQPHTLLFSEDDPFIKPPQSIKNGELVVTPFGSHMGFIAKNPLRFWLDEFILERL